MPESQERLAALLSAFQEGSLSNLASEDLEFVRLIKPAPSEIRKTIWISAAS